MVSPLFELGKAWSRQPVTNPFAIRERAVLKALHESERKLAQDETRQNRTRFEILKFTLERVRREFRRHMLVKLLLGETPKGDKNETESEA